MSSIGEIAKFRSSIQTDTINEYTSASGVTIDGVLLKDAEVTASGTNGVITNIIKAQAASGVKFQENGGAERGSYTDAGSWTWGTATDFPFATYHTTNAAIFSSTPGTVGAGRGAWRIGANSWFAAGYQPTRVTGLSGSAIVLNTGTVDTNNSIEFFSNSKDDAASGTAATIKGAMTAAGSWTLGPSSGGITHVSNGSISLGETHSVYGYASSINDDAVYSFTPHQAAGVIMISARSGSYLGVFALVAFNADASPAATLLLDPSGLFTVGTGALNGTTGTDGKMNVYTHTDGKIYIENRLGATRAISHTLLGSA